jgi:tetraacyldisaccharide 4'-kinase
MNILAYWYRKKIHPLLLPLVPLSYTFQGLTGLRRCLYRLGICKTQRCSVPVIVVGNLTVGGTGKTPFVLGLVRLLKAAGKNPGIALRGVGGKKIRRPLEVTPHSDPHEVGDEAVLLAENTACPIVACIDRVAAATHLIKLDCDLIVCDDGLQHYRLGRDLEIAMIDGDRYFGNGFLLPAGPLREPVSRLAKVNFIVVNQQPSPFAKGLNPIPPFATYPMTLEMENFTAVHDSQKKLPLSAFATKKVHAVAGIGNPQRFFEMLRRLAIEIIPHVFPDHYAYQSADLHFQDGLDIVMTEKDAIKCRHFGIKQGLWYLRVSTAIDPALQKNLLTTIDKLIEEKRKV